MHKIAISTAVVATAIFMVFIAGPRIAVAIPVENFGQIEIDSWGIVGSLNAYAEFKRAYVLGRTGKFSVIARTVEGDPIIYTYVNAGIFGLAVGTDNTQDRFGGLPGLSVRRCFILAEYKTQGGLVPFCL